MRVEGKFIILLVIPFLLLTGCWGRVELNDLAVITGISLDRTEDEQILMSVNIAKPINLGTTSGSGSNPKESTILISSKGNTIMDAYRNIKEKMPRSPFFAHSRIIIIGDELAQQGVKDVLDFFSRYRESRLSSDILFVKGNASDILKKSPNIERISSEEIRELERAGIGLKVNIGDFMYLMMEDGIEPIAAKLEMVSAEESEGTQNEKKVFGLSGAAVFKDDKLVGWMNSKETRGILWIKNQVESGVVTIQFEEGKGKGKISTSIIKGSSDIRPIIRNGKLEIDVELNKDSEVYENTTTLDLSDPSVIEDLNMQLAKDLKGRVELALEKAQSEFKSDIFGFGTAVHRTFPKKWKETYKDEWDEIFPELKVNIKANVTIHRTGFSHESITIPEKKYE